MPNSEESAEAQWSKDFRDILTEELKRVGEEVIEPDPDPIKYAHQKQLVGLAFSGGGIRSATFNLGVLQSLARQNLLSKFDYLSTVSGGGYIGSWLMAWVNRKGMKDVERNLTPVRVSQPGRKEPPEIHFLRRFSNYLTPKLGWLGADTWTVIAIYLRNLILNLIILSTAFAVVLLLPRWFVLVSRVDWRPVFSDVEWVIRFTAFAALAISAYSIARAMRHFAVSTGSEPEPVIPCKKRSAWKRESDTAWYWGDSFDEFILSLDFEIKKPGRRHIYVRAPAISRKERGALAARIEISDTLSSSDVATDGKLPMGSINGRKPERDAELLPGPNQLEVICTQNICEVRVNRVTINTCCVTRKVRSTFLWIRAPCLLIGFDTGSSAISFKKVTVKKIETPASSGNTQGQVQRRIVLPLFLAALLATYLFSFGDKAVEKVPGDISWNSAALSHPISLFRQIISVDSLKTAIGWWRAAIVGGVASGIVACGARLWLAFRCRDVRRQIDAIAYEGTSMAFAGAIGGIIVWSLYRLFREATPETVAAWGTPALIGAFLLTIVFYIGFLGRKLPDERREWWSRLSAWLLIYSLAWIAVFGLACHAPNLIRKTVPLGLGTISAGWILSTLSGLIAAHSSATGGKQSSKLVELIANVAPYIFLMGFFLFLSWGVDAASQSISKILPAFHGKFAAKVGEWFGQEATTFWTLFIMTGVLALVAVVFSLRLDINQFSMHLLYRNRLGRCYLGASNRLRRAQPFTGFSASDDVDLASLSGLSYERPTGAPYPIINAALNLVGGKELAWQQRKAASFVFTPLYCGYDFPELPPPGYCSTEKFARRPRPPVTLATAMAISGAAASPNMGYHTTPASAFLMTVFNVRLGWWLGNPREKRTWEKSGPLNVLWTLALELFGLTNEQGKFIYLSDGGHFENLGIYELVRRRCRFIVACDAEEDRAFGFGGLGNAIEKCRGDFGIDIDIDVEPIRRRSEKGYSDWHCAIGTICYSRVDADARDGILVYLKSSLTGDEPTDALRYAAANPGFPHQTTGDQWFDESQFEGYRVLGFHIAENVFGAIGITDFTNVPKEKVFIDLAQTWHPPSSAKADAFTKHTRTIVGIYDELRQNKHLKFISQQIYPEWRVLFEGTKLPPLKIDPEQPLREQLPTAAEELRAGFYICNSVFQLFEDAYVDLKLEDEFAHPDNRGWMNFFKHWSWVPIFRVAWTISASNYGARFQNFCARHLNLTVGKVVPRELEWGKGYKLKPSSGQFEWRDEIEDVAKGIVAGIWTWINSLPSGSEIFCRADITVNTLVKDSRRKIGMAGEQARYDAKCFVDAALKSRSGRPVKLYEPTTKDGEWRDAATLLEMCDRDNVDASLKQKRAEAVVDIALSHAASIERIISNTNFKDEFNPVERKLVKLFFMFNPRLAASACLHRLEVTPDPHAEEATPTRRNLHFPFGLAITARSKLLTSNCDHRQLVFFRVQDHVRKMGLAREALKSMVKNDRKLGLDLQKMHPDAYEVPTEKDAERLRRLFHSVTLEIDQKNGAV